MFTETNDVYTIKRIRRQAEDGLKSNKVVCVFRLYIIRVIVCMYIFRKSYSAYSLQIHIQYLDVPLLTGRVIICDQHVSPFV